MLYLFVIPTVLIGILVMLKLWTGYIETELFIKLCITYFVYIVVLSAIYGLQEYFKEQKILKEKNLIN